MVLVKPGDGLKSNLLSLPILGRVQFHLNLWTLAVSIKMGLLDLHRASR